VEDVSILLQNGADKISVNTSAFKKPQLINDLANEFGSQCENWPLMHRKKTGNGTFI
jgi:imidazole glycerol phosphate synthase subunit HisF